VDLELSHVGAQTDTQTHSVGPGYVHFVHKVQRMQNSATIATTSLLLNELSTYYIWAGKVSIVLCVTKFLHAYLAF
jgi:hypothetical protein